MNSTQLIPIFFATDDNYVPYLGVCIKSITENAHPMFNYKVHVLNPGLTKQNMDKLKLLETDFLKIEFNDVTSKIAPFKAELDENLRDYYSDAIYYRIFIPSMFPEYSRCIYLDADMVVLGDISRLFFTDLKGNWLGCVTDEIITSYPCFTEYANNAVGVPSKDYFNSGMLLMDIDAFRENHVETKFIKLLNKFNFNTICPDQDYLNVICKNNVLHLNNGWNKMSTKFKYRGDLFIVHYNMCRKPWLYSKVPYESYFWQYAGLTPFYEEILKVKSNFSKKQRVENIKATRKLKASALAICTEPNNFKQILNHTTIEDALSSESPFVQTQNLSPEERVALFEKVGGDYFNKDVKDDPSTVTLKNIDYLKKSPINKLKAFVANGIAKSYRKRIKKQTQLNIQGLENLKDLATGAILTSNHFSEIDNVALYWAVKEIKPKRKMWSVVREGNWAMPGIVGFFLKHCNTLPISSNYTNMTKLNKAITSILNKGDIILIYPEQALWPNYRKPRPQKLGAYFYASKNNVPVIPCFTTVDPVTNKFTLHIMPLIYPNKNLHYKQSASEMRDKCYALCVNKYEEVYGTKLTYNK